MDPQPCLTWQHRDADGAFLAERLHGGMRRRAGVPSSVRRRDLPQRQRGGGQEPVVALRGQRVETQNRARRREAVSGRDVEAAVVVREGKERRKQNAVSAENESPESRMKCVYLGSNPDE